MTTEVKKILVVEDNADLQQVLQKRLKSNGYMVEGAHGGYEGLYKYTRMRPHLILLDIMLPDLNGYEVCREIRREIKDVRTPIIMLTAKGEDFDRIKGKVIGATQYISKPFEWESLLRQINERIL